MTDGSLLGLREVPAESNRWAALGRRLLSWTVADKMRLAVDDVWEQKTLGEREFATGSKGCLVEYDEVAVLQPDGQFVVLSLADGQAKLQASLEAETALTNIYVLRSSDQYVLVTNTSQTKSLPDVNVGAVPNGAPLVNGRVYAFDRRTGQAQWKAPVQVAPFGLPLDQPTESPVFVFLRQLTASSGRTPRQTQTSILCLDKRDGRVLLAKDDIPSQSAGYKTEVKPDEHKVQIGLPTLSFTLKFTNEPPAADTGENPFEPKDSAKPSETPNKPINGG
jgi:hypothetical protein